LKGIYLIPANDQLDRHRCAAISYMQENRIEPVKLNPHQLNDYYTIPHALLYDLKKTRTHVHYLLIPSEDLIEDFINAYPARWLILKSFFTEVVFLDTKKPASSAG
jgi:hypothetical protein